MGDGSTNIPGTSTASTSGHYIGATTAISNKAAQDGIVSVGTTVTPDDSLTGTLTLA